MDLNSAELPRSMRETKNAKISFPKTSAILQKFSMKHSNELTFFRMFPRPLVLGETQFLIYLLALGNFHYEDLLFVNKALRQLGYMQTSNYTSTE